MRFISVILAVLLVLIQYPLWLGRGGWLRVWDMEHQVDVAHARLLELKIRNARLASEVNDLKDGTDAIEEHARFELGMLKKGEIFIQILDAKPETNR